MLFISYICYCGSYPHPKGCELATAYLARLPATVTSATAESASTETSATTSTAFTKAGKNEKQTTQTRNVGDRLDDAQQDENCDDNEDNQTLLPTLEMVSFGRSELCRIECCRQSNLLLFLHLLCNHAGKLDGTLTSITLLQCGDKRDFLHVFHKDIGQIAF